jgi:glycosyltransferase involved in cell wall biosynthesis
VRIGIMLRHYEQHGGGVRVYTHALLAQMLRDHPEHEYILFFNNPALIGTYGRFPNVREVCVPGTSVLLWDQIALPRALRRFGPLVLFNPKYSLPLTGRYPAAWVCHGLDWYVMPWASRFRDRLSHRFLVPRYGARASAIIAVSEVTRDHLIEFLRIPAERITTVYTGIDDRFRTRLSPEVLAQVGRAHQLPEHFVLYAGAVYPPKNFTRLVQAYARVGPRRGVSLVIAGGTNRFLSQHELAEPGRLGIENWVRWAGWVDAATLAAFYQRAQALLLPSLFESFGLPILEAMASECVVVTANRYGAREIAADAAVLVDPESVDSIAAGLTSALDDGGLRTELKRRGLERAASFTWARCAGQTLGVLKSIAQQS